MSSKREILTERETAILSYMVRNGKDKTKDDFINGFALSREGKTYRQARQAVIDQNISTWKNSLGVQRFLTEERARVQAEQERIFKNWIKERGYRKISISGKEGENAETDFDGINFQDRNEFLNFLNVQANKITDDKQRLDYLKLISDLMRLKESDQGKDDDIQRFYVPLACKECPLYAIEAEKTAPK